MKDLWGVSLAIAIIAVCIVLFFGFITTVKNAFNSPSSKGTEKYESSLSQQKERMRDVRNRQKELLRNQKDKMRDFRRR